MAVGKHGSSQCPPLVVRSLTVSSRVWKKTEEDSLGSNQTLEEGGWKEAIGVGRAVTGPPQWDGSPALPNKAWGQGALLELE